MAGKAWQSSSAFAIRNVRQLSPHFMVGRKQETFRVQHFLLMQWHSRHKKPTYCSSVREAPEVSKTTKANAIALGYSSWLWSKTPVMKISHTLATGSRERNQPQNNQETCSPWLAFIVPEGAGWVAGGEKISMVFHSPGLYIYHISLSVKWNPQVQWQ